MVEYNIQDKYKRTIDQIEKTAVINHRDPQQIKLIVVTKSHSIDTIKQVIDAGARYIGENYPEETIQKFSQLPLDQRKSIEIHMIGHLQSRKSKMIVRDFDYLQSLDSKKLAFRLDRQLLDVSKILNVLLQFEVAGEMTKFGWDASNKKNWNMLVDDVYEIKNQCKQLNISGLMTMPPLLSKEHESRKYFSNLVELGYFLREKIPGLVISEFSMGTTHDFKYAIAEGATMVRIGTAIMGSRLI